MAGFILKKEQFPSDTEKWTISSLTLVAGDLLEKDIDTDTATVSDNATLHWQRKGIVMNAAASTATEVEVKLVNPFQLWEVEPGATANASHNGQRMVLTDKNTVNNTGSDSAAQTAVVVQVGVSGSNLLVRFFDSTGVDPDAA